MRCMRIQVTDNLLHFGNTPLVMFFYVFFQKIVWPWGGDGMIDYIRKFDIELEREYYYAGEKVCGYVVIENMENLKVRG